MRQGARRSLGEQLGRLQMPFEKFEGGLPAQPASRQLVHLERFELCSS